MKIDPNGHTLVEAKSTGWTHYTCTKCLKQWDMEDSKGQVDDTTRITLPVCRCVLRPRTS
jgi:hypothetical protein